MREVNPPAEVQAAVDVAEARRAGMNAIRTTYNGIRFRSRLEARWACFFDLLGWQWQYEPLDLARYIPDFSIDAANGLLVEVKPILPGREHTGEYLQGALKAAKSGRDILVVGTHLQGTDGTTVGLIPELKDARIAGWLATQPDSRLDASVSPVIGLCLKCQRFSLISVRLDYSASTLAYAVRCLRCEPGDEDHSAGTFLPMSEAVDRMWAAAANEVQWKREGG